MTDLPPRAAVVGWRTAAQSKLTIALVGVVLLAALAAHRLGPWAWAVALILVAGAACGAWLAQRQMAADLAALVDELLAQPGPHRSPAPTSPAPAKPRPALLMPLADSLHRLAAHQQALADKQAEKLELLRHQAHSDPLTGLPNRRFFMATLDGFLASDAAPTAFGLLLLRLRNLQGMNQRIGHAATDNVLQALGQILQSYPRRIDRCCVGRLNGADFVLLLPVGGMATETAESLVQAMRLALVGIDPAASVAAGAVELFSPLSGTEALALADTALSRAEADIGFSVSGQDLDGVPVEPPPPPGHESWQRRIGRALIQGRVALADFPVHSADGRQLHLDCPLRVQLSPDGPLEPASRWLAQATRSRLCAAVDEKAMALALQMIETDGVARCVNVAAQSACASEFVAAVSRRLEAAPQAACRLWIDLPESLALERPMLVRELSRRWRPLGVMLGLEHAGAGLARIPRLLDLGLDCVRIDARFVNGLTGPDADGARRYLRGLVLLVQSVGLQVCAEGVRSAADLDLLWAMGFDAATGPAIADLTALPDSA